MKYLLKEVNLKIGEIYVSSYPDQGEYIFVCGGKKSSGSHINPSRNSLSHTGRIVSSNGFTSFREATETEKRWLRWCIWKNRFFSLTKMLEEADKLYNYQIY